MCHRMSLKFSWFIHDILSWLNSERWHSVPLELFRICTNQDVLPGDEMVAKYTFIVFPFLKFHFVARYFIVVILWHCYLNLIPNNITIFYLDSLLGLNRNNLWIVFFFLRSSFFVSILQKWLEDISYWKDLFKFSSVAVLRLKEQRI